MVRQRTYSTERENIMRSNLLIAMILAGIPVAGNGQLTPAPATMTAPLEPGEILLQTSAEGSVVLPTDWISFQFMVRSTATTEKAAKELHDRELAKFRADLLATGLPATALSAPKGSTTVRAVEFMMPGQSAKEPAFASSSHQITVEDMRIWPAVRDVLSRHKIDLTGAVIGGGAKLRSDQVGRQKAIADGINKARMEAEAYAAPLKMRIARILRVSDSLSLADLAGSFQDRVRTPDGSLETVTVTAPVSIDFALKPL